MALRTLGKVSQPLLGAVTPLFSGRGHIYPVVLPEGKASVPETPREELDNILTHLEQSSSQWAALSASARADLIEKCIEPTLAVIDEASAASVKAKGSYGVGLGEEILSWAPIVSGLREFTVALRANGHPSPISVSQRADGQYVVDVLPSGLQAVLLGGAKGELWIKPGEKPTQGAIYRERNATTGVALVLGAGNQISVAALDILHKLIVDNEVVVCKMNPVNEYLGPFLEIAFEPLVRAGFVRIVYGGGAQGAYLVNHDIVKSVHLTGSEATYNAIVWGGTPRVGEDPPLKKHVSAELGCVTPYIIVPGVWSKSDLLRQAESIVSGLSHNCGHNCLKAELVLVDADWPQRAEFQAAIRQVLNTISRRHAYYPGSEAKFERFSEKFGDVEELGADTSGESSEYKVSPWLFKVGLTPETVDASTENWCGALQEVGLLGSGGDPTKFLKSAVEFANHKAWGTLSCALFVDPKTRAQLGDAYDDAIAALKYGSININAPGIIGFALTKLSWGGFPGSTQHNIGSGNCAVHNTMLFDHVEKSVLTMPFRFHPKPFWSPLHTNSTPFAHKFVKFSAYPTFWNFVNIVPSALIG